MALEKQAAQIKEVEITHKKEGESISLKAKLKDPEYRRKILRWMFLPIGLMNLGIIDSQGGATLLDLQILTSTDEQMSGLYFTAYNLGYALGSILVGYCYGKINSYLLLTICCVMAGGVNIAIPYCGTFLLMCISRCIVGCFLGVIQCIISAEHMHIWGSKGDSLLQLINFAYAVGGVVGPMVANPFIAEKEREHETSRHQNVSSHNHRNQTMIFNNSSRNTETYGNSLTYNNITTDNFINHNVTLDNFINLTVESYNHTDASKSNLPRSTNVHYAFLIGGLTSVTIAIPFLITLLTLKTSSSHAKERGGSSIPDRKLPTWLKVFLAGLLFSYFLCYCSIEVIISSHLLVFIVSHFESIGTHDAAYVMTYYWGMFATGRFISIFTSKYISARKLLYIHLTMIVTAIAGFIASALLSKFSILVGFACLMGLSCSAMYAAGISWTQAELMKVTGPVSAVIFVGASAGAMLSPFLVGYLMVYVSYIWFCYSIVVVLVLSVSVLVVMMTFNRCYVNRKYGKLGVILVLEKPVGIRDIVAETSYF